MVLRIIIRGKCLLLKRHRKCLVCERTDVRPPVWRHRSKDEARSFEQICLKVNPRIFVRVIVIFGRRATDRGADSATDGTPKGDGRMTGGDYIAEVKRLLKEVPMMSVIVQNLTEEIAELEALLADESITSTRLDNIGGGRSAGELTATEAAAARRVKMERRIIDLRHRIVAIERKQRALNRAINALQDDEREIIRARKAGLSWEMVACKLNYSVKWSQEKNDKAIKAIAVMMFGEV